jgi:hypothetical protein
MTVSMNMRSAATPSFVSAEEVMEGLFRALCGDQEPIACESFEIASRAVRMKMLRSAVALLQRLPDAAPHGLRIWLTV